LLIWRESLCSTSDLLPEDILGVSGKVLLPVLFLCLIILMCCRGL